MNLGSGMSVFTNAQLEEIGDLVPGNGNFIVGDGITWSVESGATVRTSLGLGTGDSPVFTGMSGTLATAAQPNITSTGALNGGSITSGFGEIDNGSSDITTLGILSGGFIRSEGGKYVLCSNLAGDENIRLDFQTADPKLFCSHHIDIYSESIFAARFDGNQRFGLGVSTVTALFHAVQVSTTAAIPVVRLDQRDVSEGFIDFVGDESADALSSISTLTTPGATTKQIQVYVKGVKGWVAWTSNDPS